MCQGSIDGRFWILGSGLRTVGSGLWALESGLRGQGSGLWTLGSGLRTLGSGVWAEYSGLWGSRQQAGEFRRWAMRFLLFA